MELIPGSETSTHLIQTPGIYPEDNTLKETKFIKHTYLKSQQPKQSRQCTRKLTLGRGRVTTVVEAKQYYVFWVCVCSLSYPACIAYAPCSRPWSARRCNIFPHNKHKMCVLVSSTNFVWKCSDSKELNKRRSNVYIGFHAQYRYMYIGLHVQYRYVYRSSCTVPLYVYRSSCTVPLYVYRSSCTVPLFLSDFSETFSR
jgi:hypothetical protein